MCIGMVIIFALPLPEHGQLQVYKMIKWQTRMDSLRFLERQFDRVNDNKHVVRVSNDVAKHLD
jgi:hypothetical protein